MAFSLRFAFCFRLVRFARFTIATGISPGDRTGADRFATARFSYTFAVLSFTDHAGAARPLRRHQSS